MADLLFDWFGFDQTSKAATANSTVAKQWAGALVQWLWEETHVPKGVGSNHGAIYWMDMTFFHIDLL